MKFPIILIIFLIFLAFPITVNAQVVINELSPSEEWVELFNTSSSELNLEGCVLNMGNSGQDIIFSSSDTILASGYKVAEKNVTSGWTSNWINNSGDTVSLDCPSVGDDGITFGSEIDTKTYGRSPNGIGSFAVLETATKGTANPDPTPSPSPTPTSTPTPTVTPTSTPTPAPTPTPTKTPTPTPLKTKTPSPTATSEETATPESLVLAAVATSEAKGKFPLLSVIFILGGLACIGGAILGIIKKKNEALPENS